MTDLTTQPWYVIEVATEIAKVCHAANKALCEAYGDFTQKTWDEAEQWQRDSAIKGVIFAVDNPDAPPSAQHDSWMQEKLLAGWVYGPHKDDKASPPTHPCLVPYSELPAFQRARDGIFQAIARTSFGEDGNAVRLDIGAAVTAA